MFEALPAAPISEELTQLVYELLDAHEDTARLAEEAASEAAWALHLDYLRDLQRVGREVLGKAAVGWRG
jgi:Na+/phosphate symporter